MFLAHYVSPPTDVLSHSYPATRRLTPGQSSAEQVFTPSLVETINAHIFAPRFPLSNIASQAVLNASAVGGTEYSMTLLTPPIGGQRQAYTQASSRIPCQRPLPSLSLRVFSTQQPCLTVCDIKLATEMVASTQQIVVTVDHSYQSGAVELKDHKVLYNLAGPLIKAREADFARAFDLMAVANYFYNLSGTGSASAWASFKIVSNNTRIFGHGQGGLVAKALVDEHIFADGGSLDGLVRMPAPYVEMNVLFTKSVSPPATSLDGRPQRSRMSHTHSK